MDLFLLRSSSLSFTLSRTYLRTTALTFVDHTTFVILAPSIVNYYSSPLIVPGLVHVGHLPETENEDELGTELSVPSQSIFPTILD